VHDLDVLLDCVKKSDSVETEESRKFLGRNDRAERQARIENLSPAHAGQNEFVECVASQPAKPTDDSKQPPSRDFEPQRKPLITAPQDFANLAHRSCYL